MYRLLIVASMLAALFVIGSGVSAADDGMTMSMGEEETSSPAVDPVSGNKVTAEEAPEAVFLDTLFRFESAENLAKFRAEPEMYATVACPVSGEPVRIRDAKAKMAHAGRTWYFCCNDCVKKFEKNAAKYVTIRCPVSGEVVLMADATKASVEGRDVYFCCGGCKPAFERHAARLFGMIVPEGGDAKAAPAAPHAPPAEGAN
jgi:YHS domain-containing protein